MEALDCGGLSIQEGKRHALIKVNCNDVIVGSLSIVK